MVIGVRCEEIAEEKLKQFTSDDDWLALKEAVEAGPVSGIGATLSSILEIFCSLLENHRLCNISHKSLPGDMSPGKMLNETQTSIGTCIAIAEVAAYSYIKAKIEE
ncbi:unnamed protein product [Dovyalis caffra]|uniref:Uncharacterized protein n=1 Tax=Dovyalis caffra TaxID=77055 RepID=A0AAV1RJK0_9ROSI|nr:unnamed protein product [Dovyalis caffra]